MQVQKVRGGCGMAPASRQPASSSRSRVEAVRGRRRLEVIVEFGSSKKILVKF